MAHLSVAEANKSNVLLTELVIVILFFALTAATAMQMFVGAHQKSRMNVLTNRALIIAQDWAELLIGDSDPEAQILAAGFAQDASDSAMYLKPADDRGDSVKMTVSREATGAGELVSVMVSVYNREQPRRDDGEPEGPLAAIPIVSYFPEGGASDAR